MVALLLVVYGPVLQADFVNWDDQSHVYKNPRVLEADGWRRSWSDVSEPGPYPVLFTTYYLEWRLATGRPWLFHLDNVLLHAANAVLVGRLAGALGLAPAASSLVAALWALHPMQVESVAWVAERKNVLYAFFWLTSLLLYLRSSTGKGRSGLAYGASLAAFALALLSKSAAVTLPVVLVLVEWARGRRLDRRLCLALTPYVLLAVAGGVGLLLVVGDLPKRPPLGARLWLAARAFWFYIGAFIWPHELVPIYAKWSLSPIGAREVGSLLGLIAVAAGVIALRRRLPRAVLLGAGLFVTNIALVLGVVWNTYFRFAFVADRYVYLPSVGLALAAVTGLEAATRAAGLPARVASGGIALWCVALAVATRLQVPVWHDSETLWRFTLARNPRCAACHLNLAVVLGDRGDAETAAAHYHTSLEIDPNPKAAIGLANIRIKQGQLDEARELYEDALRADATNAMAQYNLANVLRKLGRTDEAIARYHEAIRLDPEGVEPHHNLAVTLLRAGRIDEAEAEFQSTLRLSPDDAATHFNLGLIAADREQWSVAAEHYARALQGTDDALPLAPMHHNLGRALTEQGKLAEAIPHYEEARRLAPDDVDVRADLLDALVDSGRFGDAIAILEDAVALKPDAPELAGPLAWLRATSPEARWRDGPEAVRLAERAATQTPEADPDVLDTLAAAYAEAGRFADAVRTARHALELVDPASDLAAAIRARLALYRAGKPYRLS